MAAIQVVVRRTPNAAPSSALAPLYGLLDVLVDGVNITARIGHAEGLALLAELGHAIAGLACGRRKRCSLPLYTDDEAWELGLERDADDVLVTVFRSGADPEIAVHERRVGLAELRDGVLLAIIEQYEAATTRAVRGPLRAARDSVRAAWPPCPLRAAARQNASIRAASNSFAFELEGRFRVESADDDADAEVERADLHGLLGRGTFTVVAGERTVQLGSVPLYIVVERVIALAEDALVAARAERPLVRRAQVAGIRFGIRRGPGDGGCTLLVASREHVDRGEQVQLPGVDERDFARATLALARDLHAAFVKHDPSQIRNLRLRTLTDATHALASRISEGDLDDRIENLEPESYRAFASTRRKSARGAWEHGSRMRFLPQWVATVPGIDLAATFLCGDRLIVGSTREIAAIDRVRGTVLWRKVASRAATVVTPSALVRVQPTGTLTLHDLDTGEVRSVAHVAPRSAGRISGAVVHQPGLPKLLVVAEGDAQVTAVDLVSGEIRWRHTSKRCGALRVRRAGRLLVVSADDTSLVALDATTGEVVWRARHRLPFSADSTIDRDDAFVVGGTPGAAIVHRMDPWTGAIVWTASVGERPTAGRPPLVTARVILVPTRDARGSGIMAFDRETGAPLWAHEPGLAAPVTAWLEVDDAIVANSSSGTLLCVDAETGRLVYNHVFTRSIEADQPRRLEPVLRNGALFVPQREVQVVRPKTGEILGTLPSDLIPDLVRVDERCSVYVAEESGHVAAFAAAPRLALVK